ncbi:hypothetical protein NQ318_017403 [Aromia moschata]|uniref:Uncharacterized protein n=1 Tax=Aromia moschata TaxID=1265417 RepID=A0AAV8Z503_9CUCU|nr:hypothetical protein NQ318_017403 [Aromia moschata]
MLIFQYSFDRQITPTNSTQDIAEVLQDKGDELVVYGSDTNRFLHSDTLPCNKKNKQSVIDGAEHSYDRLLNQRSANTRKRKYEESKNRNRNIFITSHKPKSLDTDNQANERKLSSKSLLNREVSKEYSDTSPEYTSLPFLKIEELDFSRGTALQIYFGHLAIQTKHFRHSQQNLKSLRNTKRENYHRVHLLGALQSSSQEFSSLFVPPPPVPLP